MTETRGAEYYAAQASTFETLYRAQDMMNDQYGSDLEGRIYSPTGAEYEADREGNETYAELMDLIDNVDGDDISEDSIREALDDMPLCIDVRKVYSIVLSFGGPNASVNVTTYCGVIESMEYTFGWGGETYTKRLTEDDAMGRYAAEQVERMIECEQ